MRITIRMVVCVDMHMYVCIYIYYMCIWLYVFNFMYMSDINMNNYAFYLLD